MFLRNDPIRFFQIASEKMDSFMAMSKRAKKRSTDFNRTITTPCQIAKICIVQKYLSLLNLYSSHIMLV